MKRTSLMTAVAIIVVANAFALIHAWRNRTGPVEADITVTERELRLSRVQDNDDSGVTLALQWLDPTWRGVGKDSPTHWLDEAALRNLGFDTSVRPSDLQSAEFYRRQRLRRAYVALEYDGPAWRKRVERVHLAIQEQAEQEELGSHVVVVDADSDATRLRARHGDRNAVIVVPAVVRIVLQEASAKPNAEPARLIGYVLEIPSSVHVPLPYSDAFRRLPKDQKHVHYRVHLRYGKSFEPWVAGVEFVNGAR